MTLLTKSKYLAGLQCPKQLWIQMNEKDLIPEIDAATQKLFDVGSKVGELATKIYPNGIKVTEKGFIENINQTKELLKENKPLFEAGFMTSNLFSRADILAPNKDGYDIIEVKSSTQVKDVNIHDVSFQKHVYELKGLKINKCYLMFINNEYVKQGEIDPEKLFKKEDITELVNEYSQGIQERIDEMLEVIKKEKPNTPIGKHCDDPYACPLKSICWSHVPKNSVFTLTRGGKRSWNLYNSNILKIKDIPDDFKLSAKQEIQKNCEINETVHIDKKAINKFLQTLEYPIYYFDFEIINPCLPLYDGMKPYKRIPFQYSLHVQEKPDGKVKHISFLADHNKDPRKQILESMKQTLGSKGTILAWNESFEKGVIKELIEYYPEYKDWGEKIIERFNDLIIPFRNYAYYNPVQEGSSSIKKVLPALTNLSYEELDIANGSDASNAYENLCTKEVPHEQVEKIRSDLEKYCELDTLAEVEILKALKEIVEK